MTKKQKMAVAVILLITALLAGLIVMAEKNGSDSHDDHGEAAHQHTEKEKTAQPESGHEEEKDHQDEKISLTDDQVAAAGIVTQRAGPAHLQNVLTLPGEIRYNEDRTAHVVPKVTGVVASVPAELGQKVKKGQVLAVIASSTISERRGELLTAQQRLELARSTYAREKKLWQEKISAEQDYLQARQTLREAEIAVQNAREKLTALGPNGTAKGPLNRFEIRAPFDGMVMEKHITLGETVKEDANIFTLSDLSTVWAEIAIPAKNLNDVRVGKAAIVKATAFDSNATGRISYVGSLLGEQTRSAQGRIVLPNPHGTWRPGLFVSVDIATDATDVPVAVASEALQTLEGKTVVFVRVPGGFIAQPVTTGRSDGKRTAITHGLQAGVEYAVAGSFLLKAEHGKASAEHAH